ncbi:MAG TPA: carboxypeptidase regulatory-like domain-containing protein [Bryobacteraceae bacterium]|nr:carboxypeptidase regulatory-like domain-containing protein [Bryobacteraceae bacterium]
MIKPVAKLAGFMLLCGVLAFAQSERGSIRGVVEDASGAVLPGAKVTAVNVGTNVETSTLSMEAGNYNLPELPPGRYVVQVELKGFKKLVRENVTVQVSGVTPLDLRMEVGEVSESVTVTAAPPALKSETSDVSMEVNPKSYNDLPLTSAAGMVGGRGPEAFIFLSPGVTPGVHAGGLASDTFDAHINGSPTLSKEMQVDGMSTQTAEVQGDPRNLTFPPDAVQEMSLLTSSYSAEFGNSGGGVERYVIKSGTNEFHGNLYEFLRNTAFDARGFFSDSVAVHHENEFGGTFGGPVWIPKLYNGKNKTFFFVNIEEYRLHGGAQNSIGSVPNQDFRNGNLSGLVDAAGNQIPIYDPNTTTALPGGGFTRNQFPGNIIPADRISAVSKNILSYVPQPARPGIYNNYPSSGSSVTNYGAYTFKVDQYFTPTQHLSGMWNQSYNDNNGPYSILPNPVQSTRDGATNIYTGRLSYDWTLTPTLLNTFRFGFNRQSQYLGSKEASEQWGTKLGLNGINNGFPAVGWGAFTALAQNQDLLGPISNTFLFADSVSWTKGKHNIKIGEDLRRLQHQGVYPSRDAYFNFSTLETGLPGSTATTGNEFASFLLGQVDSTSMYINDVVAGMRLWYSGAYIQDDWKVSRKLTLNLGVRWDVFTPYEEVANRYSIMDPTKPNPAAGGLLGAYVFAGGNAGTDPYTGTSRLTSNQDTAWHNFGPRLGFAYKVTERSVVRGGYGISFYPDGGLGGGNVTAVTDGFSSTASFSSLNNGVSPAFVWDNGFPQNYTHPPSITSALNIGQGASMWWDNASQAMYKQDWNLTTQHQLTSNLVLDVAYVGSKSTRVGTGAVNPDQVAPQYLSLGSLLSDDIYSPAVAAAGFHAPYAGFQGSLAQALRPFPQYNGVGTLNSANIGNATYNSLQVKFEKRLSQGLWLLASYTWSKTISDANSQLGGFFSSGARDNYNRSLEKALAVYDVPSRLVVGFNYELPIGPGKPVLSQGLASKILGGWQVNGILTYQSGVPIQISANNTLPLFNSGNTPNSVLGAKVENSFGGFDPNKDVLLNASAFTLPAAGQYGTSAQILPNARSFPVYNEDFGLQKKFFIREPSVYVELRFEMFNGFNRVVFAGPASNLNSANFGQVSSQGNVPRNCQVAAKFYF